MHNPGHLIIGAECGVQIGTGHVMRCLALAQAWKRSGGTVTFLLPDGSPGIEQRIRSEGFSLELLKQNQFADAVVNRMLEQRESAANLRAVLDGYNFGAREQAALSNANIATLTIDDYGHAKEYPGRWVLNQNAGAKAEIYARRSSETKLLLGPAYALLRDEFRPWLAWNRNIPEKASKILITIGGSDPDNLSLRILKSLADLSLAAFERAEFEVILVVGSSNPHFEVLQSAAERSQLRIRFVRNTTDMPALMAWADIAISGAGGTAHELCYMGLPSLLFVIAENQRGVAENLSKMSAAVHAGAGRDFDHDRFADAVRELIESRERRTAMSKRARDLVDGLGADRVRAALLDRQLALRPLRKEDCELLFSWANDPAVRGASFYSDRILWEDHQRWFALKLDDPQSVIYIGETCSGDPIGQVRFQLDRDRAALSVVVAPKFRRTGWGRELIAFSIRLLARTRFVHRVDAFVKPENAASIRLFESAGFCRTDDAQVAGQPALTFTWEALRAPRSELHAS